MTFRCGVLEELIGELSNDGWGEKVDPVSIGGAILQEIAHSEGHYTLEPQVIESPGFKENVRLILKTILKRARQGIRNPGIYLWLTEGYSYRLEEMGYSKVDADNIADNITSKSIRAAIRYLRSTGVPIYLSNYAAFTDEIYNYFDSEWLTE